MILSVISALIVISCTRSANPNIERGSTYKYRAGFPEVRFSAVGFLNERNQPSIEISADIVYGSLIFKEVDGSQQANIAIDVRVINQNDAEDIVESKHYEFDIENSDNNLINSQQSYIFEKRLDVPAGEYKVYFTVIDLNSDKEITRVANTGIPNPEINKIDLTDIRMLGKNVDADSAQWLPVTTYDVQGSIDSLMFIFQATNTSSDQPLTINTKLVQFESDSSNARPMYYNDYSPSTIEYKGIDLDDQTVIQQSQRRLLDEGSVFIEFKFAQQERGNYRFKVESNKEDAALFKARDFSVKSTNYPALKTARELARPLVYLMNDKEYEELMAIDNQDSLKQAIDRFWLREIGNKNEAINVLKLYYQRAEEANKQFSNFKEGWKTDPGMIYILFGPPWYIDRRLDQMKWSYSYNRNDPERNFFFMQPKLQNKFYPFDHYVLQRDQSYFQIQYQQRQLWLSGLILQRSI
jgi:GWxTD domain-containing protein